MKRFKSGIAVVALITFFYLSGFLVLKNIPSVKSSKVVRESSESTQSSASAAPLYKVVKVVDGDTIDVEIDGKAQRVRLIGINTPETVDPRKPVECFGNEASAKMKQYILGKQVSLQLDTTQASQDVY